MISVPILQMRTLRHSEVKLYSQLMVMFVLRFDPGAPCASDLSWPPKAPPSHVLSYFLRQAHCGSVGPQSLPAASG